MNPEIRKLQYLNNLITQTLDVLTRQPMNVMPTVNPYHTGLTHTPWENVNPGWGTGYGMGLNTGYGFNYDPRFVQGTHHGLTHTGYTNDPRWTQNWNVPMTDYNFIGMHPQWNQGLTHTGYTYDPRWTQNWNVPMTDYNFIGMHPQWNQGLTHTPYYNRTGYNLNVPFVDPRYGWINQTTPFNYNW